VTLQIPKMRSLPFETAIIERYRRRETSVEEVLIEMYLAGDSVFSPLIAAKATFALKPAEWFLRGRLLIGSPRHSQIKAVHQQNRHLYPCSVFLSHLYPLLLIRPQ
jgi:hypothetical protein